jgi:hypothetical protein
MADGEAHMRYLNLFGKAILVAAVLAAFPTKVGAVSQLQR